MKTKISELINKIYEEQDKKKIYNLIFELYLLQQEDKEKLMENLLKIKDSDEQIEKIGEIVILDEEWRNFRDDKLKLIETKGG